MISQAKYLLNKINDFERRLANIERHSQMRNSLYLGDTAFRVDSGPRQWTTNATWTNINSSIFKIRGSDFQLTKVYFEVLGCVETSGRTAYFRIYNVTDSEALSGSEVSTTAVSNDGEGWINAELIRSDAITFPTDEKEYRLQFKQSVAGGAGDATQFFKGALIYKQD